MAAVNALARELVFKIVYYGPGLGGKTTTLQHIHATVKAEHRGKMVSLATPVDRTLYFDYLPIRLPKVRGMGVRLQLFTVPGQVYYNATRKLVLTGADGVVFVADSQPSRMDANLGTLENLRENLREHNRSLATVPHVFQYNKRDLADALPTAELDRSLNELHAPFFGTVATAGNGVYESLEAISKLVIAAFEATMPAGDRHIAADLEAIEGGLSEALRNVDGGEPPAPAVIPTVAQPAALKAAPAELVEPPQRPPSHPLQQRQPVPPLQPLQPPLPPVASLPEDPGMDAPGEMAARVLLKADAQAPFTLAELWPEGERESVRQVESAIMGRRYAKAIELCDALVARVLTSAAGLFGSAEAPRDPATVPLLLGLDGRQYLSFRALVCEARAGQPVEARRALEALTFAAQTRILRSSL